MKFVNDYDISRYVEKYSRPQHYPGASIPIPATKLHEAALLLKRVARDADENSDGWHSWMAPCRAAQKLIALLDSGNPDPAAYRAALTPIRAFYTRTRAKVPSYPQFPAVTAGPDSLRMNARIHALRHLTEAGRVLLEELERQTDQRERDKLGKLVSEISLCWKHVRDEAPLGEVS